MKETIVVTGAGHRVGFAIAKALLVAGYNIIAHYRKNRDELDRWLEKAPQYLKSVQIVQADLVTNSDALTTCIKNNPSIKGVVNSASVFEIGELTDGVSLIKNMEINTMVPLALASALKDRSGSSVINIVDANISRVNCHFQSYRVSKLFLQEITRQLAVSLAPDVRVNGVAPGTVLPPEGQMDESYLKARRKAPLGRDAALADVTGAVLFLLENRSITGEIIPVDCGVHAL